MLEQILHIRDCTAWYRKTMDRLSERHCIPCEGGTMPLARRDAEKLLDALNNPEVWGKEVPRQSPLHRWDISLDGKRIVKQFKFQNFIKAMDFANKITPIAEAESHHPDLSIGWGRVDVELSTHAIDGLSENDFILAAKIDDL
jgi:4a-hydroxytetrahydrobiopterin dehydratase